MINLRSFLFTPGHRGDRFEKGLASGTDALVLDWEDGVGPDLKETAREQVVQFYRGRAAEGPARVGVRLNAMESPAIHADIQALLAGGIRPDFLMLAKTEGERDVELLDAWLGPACRDIPIVVLVESLAGLDHIDASVRRPRVAGVVFGVGDLSSEMGLAADNWEGLLHGRQLVARAAHRARILAIDGPCLAIQDHKALEEETRKAVRLGFEAKIAIHPLQVGPIQHGFSPPQADLEWAAAVLRGYREHQHNAFRTERGEMIDRAVVRRAERLLQRQPPPAREGKPEQ